MHPSLSVVAFFMAQIAADGSIHSGLDSGVDLAELVRSSNRIVLGRVERVEHVERPPPDRKIDERFMTHAEKRWKDVSSVPLAELKIEQPFKGRPVVQSLWFYARLRSGGGTREAAPGERLLLFLGEPIHYIPFGREFRDRVHELTGDYRVEEVALDGSVSIDPTDEPAAHCAAGIALPQPLAKLAVSDEHGTRVAWKVFETELSQILARQLPIIHAFDSLHGDWELFVYGDRRCVVVTASPASESRRAFDLASERYASLWEMFGTERFRELPESMGRGSPDDSDCQGIDITTSERTQSVRIWDARTPGHPISSAAMSSAVRLMFALKSLNPEPRDRESR